MIVTSLSLSLSRHTQTHTPCHRRGEVAECWLQLQSRRLLSGSCRGLLFACRGARSCRTCPRVRRERLLPQTHAFASHAMARIIDSRRAEKQPVMTSPFTTSPSVDADSAFVPKRRRRLSIMVSASSILPGSRISSGLS
jgi:hypothetical protein